MFLTEFQDSNLDIFKSNLEKNRLPDKKKYIDKLKKNILNFFVLSIAIGKYTLYRQIEKEEQTLTFADIKIPVDSEILTVKQFINVLESLIKVKKGSIYETVLDQGGEALAEAVYSKSYEVFIETINKKMFDAEIVSYATWLESLTAEGIKLDAAIVNKSYWSTVYETNMGNLFNQGRIEETERLKDHIQFEQYNAVMDSATTATCAELNGKIVKIGGFGAFYPINHYHCRSIVDIISNYRAKIQGFKASKLDLKNVTISDKNFHRVFSIKDLTKDLIKEG